MVSSLLITANQILKYYLYLDIIYAVPVTRISSYTAPSGSNIGASITLTCTATAIFTNVSIGIFNPEGLEVLPVTTTRDVKAQTQTVAVTTRIARALQSYECRLSSGGDVDQRTVTVEGYGKHGNKLS